MTTKLNASKITIMEVSGKNDSVDTFKIHMVALKHEAEALINKSTSGKIGLPMLK